MSSDCPDTPVAHDDAAIERVRRDLAEFAATEAPEPPPELTARLVEALRARRPVRRVR